MKRILLCLFAIFISWTSFAQDESFLGVSSSNATFGNIKGQVEVTKHFYLNKNLNFFSNSSNQKSSTYYTGIEDQAVKMYNAAFLDIDNAKVNQDIDFKDIGFSVFNIYSTGSLNNDYIRSQFVNYTYTHYVLKKPVFIDSKSMSKNPDDKTENTQISDLIKDSKLEPYAGKTYLLRKDFDIVDRSFIAPLLASEIRNLVKSRTILMDTSGNVIKPLLSEMTIDEVYNLYLDKYGRYYSNLYITDVDMKNSENTVKKAISNPTEQDIRLQAYLEKLLQFTLDFNPQEKIDAYNHLVSIAKSMTFAAKDKDANADPSKVMQLATPEEIAVVMGRQISEYCFMNPNFRSNDYSNIYDRNGESPDQASSNSGIDVFVGYNGDLILNTSFDSYLKSGIGFSIGKSYLYGSFYYGLSKDLNFSNWYGNVDLNIRPTSFFEIKTGASYRNSGAISAYVKPNFVLFNDLISLGVVVGANVQPVFGLNYEAVAISMFDRFINFEAGFDQNLAIMGKVYVKLF